MKYLICGLDGTLADCSDRLRHIDPSYCVKWVQKMERKNPYTLSADALSELKRMQAKISERGSFREEWDLFFSDDEIVKDGIIASTFDLISYYAIEGRLVFFTGRPEKTRAATRSWLKCGKFSYTDGDFADSPLIMRPDGNHEDDTTLKVKMLRGFAPPSEVLAVLEDRSRVVKALRDDGYTVWQVAEGDY